MSDFWRLQQFSQSVRDLFSLSSRSFQFVSESFLGMKKMRRTVEIFTESSKFDNLLPFVKAKILPDMKTSFIPEHLGT